MVGFRLLVIFWGVFLVGKSFAKDLVELPPEELAQESVTPVFDKNPATKNRIVVTEHMWEIGGSIGTALTEPIFNVNKLSGSLFYHPSEASAWGFIFVKNSAGVTNYAKALDSQYGLDFTRAPAPDSSYMFEYDRKFFYGKMSLSKNTVTHLHIFASGAVGMIKYQNATYPAADVGLGEKFYFNSQWSLRVDFRLWANNAPVPFLGNNELKPSQTPIPPDYSQFNSRLTFTSVMDIGVNYLF